MRPPPARWPCVCDVQVQLLSYPAAWSGPGDWQLFGALPATYQTAFDPLPDAQRPQCYTQVLPAGRWASPRTPASGSPRAPGRPSASASPWIPLSLTAFDSLTLTREPIPSVGNLPTSDYVVGSVGQSADLRRVTFVPGQPLAHEQGVSESYFLTLANVGGRLPAAGPRGQHRRDRARRSTSWIAPAAGVPAHRRPRQPLHLHRRGAPLRQQARVGRPVPRGQRPPAHPAPPRDPQLRSRSTRARPSSSR